jgi:hypothetical protein
MREAEELYSETLELSWNTEPIRIFSIFRCFLEIDSIEPNSLNFNIIIFKIAKKFYKKNLLN